MEKKLRGELEVPFFKGGNFLSPPFVKGDLQADVT
jgi:hypothetical protein